MPIETRSNSALFRRADQLKRWEISETNQVSSVIPKDKKIKIKFSDGCVFLAACAASDTEEVERLLKNGTDINTANVDGLTSLHQACIDNNLEMVQFLVEHGCQVNQGDNEGWTPLHATASCGFLSIAKYLIEHGANVAAVNNDGDLPIDIAESSEMEEYLSDVLDEQAIDCDLARSEEQQIMLIDAKSMLESGIDLNDRIHPRTCATPLHVAAAKGYIDVLKLLVQAGADLNAQDSDGWTPLHGAAHWGQKEACAILADNLANMDIQNLAGQTCYDVAEPELVKLLEELKKKQTHMQKDRPDIQAILQRTSNKPPLKRRTSVTRMSGHEKSKSVMKDTKSERAQIENLCLPEEETDEEKVLTKRNTERMQSIIERYSTFTDETVKSKEIPFKCTEEKKESIQSSEKPSILTSKVTEKPHVNETEVEKVPSWKKVLRKSGTDPVLTSADTDIAEITLKRPKKARDSEDNSSRYNDGSVATEGRSIQSREDESELQRKAHAKRVRETRRSTQGVLLEDLKSAELQYLINTQQHAAKRQAEEAKSECDVDSSITKGEIEKTSPTEKTFSSKVIKSQDISSKEDSVKDNAAYKLNSSKNISSKDILPRDTSFKHISSKDLSCKDHLPTDKKNSCCRTSKLTSDDSKDTGEVKSSMPENYRGDINEEDGGIKKLDKSSSNETSPSVTLVLRSKSSSTLEDTSPTDIKSSLGTQAAIQRRRRPKRRSTGVVYLDSDDGQEEKDKSADKENTLKHETFQSERSRQRYGSSSSIPDTASEGSSRNDVPSDFSSHSSLNDEENKEYKKLYEETKKENEQLKEGLKKTEEDLEKTKKQLQRMPQNNSFVSSLSETEKKERRSLERKISEMEEEIKQIEKLKADNERLNNENKALIRVISKLSK